MTIILTGATQQFIIVTADSAVTDDINGGTERIYKHGHKIFNYEGIGFVATWGARTGNNIERYLDTRINRDVDISRLADLTLSYLIDEYKADDPVSDDIGYHVAGFDRQGNAHLYHIFWGIPRPNHENQAPDYGLNDHSPNEKAAIQLLYNGRNDLADIMIKTLIREIQRGRDVRFDITTPIGMAELCDYVVRMGAEMTPEVGPPFKTTLMSPENKIKQIINRDYAPISRDELQIAVTELGLEALPTSYELLQTKDIIPSVYNYDVQPSGVILQRIDLPEDNLSNAGGTITAFPPPKKP